MDLYFFRDPRDYSFARAVRLGTWEADPGPGVCPECRASRQSRVPPLIMEWVPESDVIGDFTWPGIGEEMVVTQRVREEFERRFCCFEFREVQMHQNPRLKRPTRTTKRTKPRVWLPYQGPPLWDFQSTATVRLDLTASHVKFLGNCAGCGRELYEAPPVGAGHLVVDISFWQGQDIFRIHEFKRFVYCTERVKEFVEASGFTNVSFQLDGEIPS